jgi:hypothetical protein
MCCPRTWLLAPMRVWFLLLGAALCPIGVFAQSNPPFAAYLSGPATLAPSPPPDFLTNVHNYDDPLCLAWSNGCEICRRDKNRPSVINCNRIGDTCEIHYTICNNLNTSVARKICDALTVADNDCVIGKDNTQFKCSKCLPRKEVG